LIVQVQPVESRSVIRTKNSLIRSLLMANFQWKWPLGALWASQTTSSWLSWVCKILRTSTVKANLYWLGNQADWCSGCHQIAQRQQKDVFQAENWPSVNRSKRVSSPS